MTGSKQVAKKRSVKEEPEVFTPEQLDEMKIRLEYLETQIDKGIIAYYTAGNLLREIREKKLYAARNAKTFEDYSKERFDISRSYGYRLIAAYYAWELLGKPEERIPESKLRLLTGLPEKKVQQAWKCAQMKAGTDSPSVENIQDAITEITDKASCGYWEKRSKNADKLFDALLTREHITSIVSSFTKLKKFHKFDDDKCQQILKRIEELQKAELDKAKARILE